MGSATDLTGVFMSNAAPAGWYPDPSNGQQQRFWDGHEWTTQTRGATQVAQQVFVRPRQEKSVAVGVILTILFGPFGFFYVSAIYALVALGFAVIIIILASFTMGLAFIPYWIFMIVWIVRLVNDYNERLREEEGAVVISAPATGIATVTETPAISSVNQLCVVHVVGAVANPGVYQMRQGSRVHEAIERAGGMTASADASQINMARVIIDGEQIVVP